MGGKPIKTDIKKGADRYAKVVEWSEEDGCYVGRVPALGYGGVHGADRAQVFAGLCDVAEEIVAILEADGRALPDASPRSFSGRFVLRILPGLHEALALKAEQTGRSLNAMAEAAIRKGVATA